TDPAGEKQVPCLPKRFHQLFRFEQPRPLRFLPAAVTVLSGIARTKYTTPEFLNAFIPSQDLPLFPSFELFELCHSEPVLGFGGSAAFVALSSCGPSPFS